jgi:hypothetical protein
MKYLVVLISRDPDVWTVRNSQRKQNSTKRFSTREAADEWLDHLIRIYGA